MKDFYILTILFFFEQSGENSFQLGLTMIMDLRSWLRALEKLIEPTQSEFARLDLESLQSWNAKKKNVNKFVQKDIPFWFLVSKRNLLSLYSGSSELGCFYQFKAEV